MNTQHGWGGRIRTYECSSQSAVSYRLTTPQYLIFLTSHMLAHNYKKINSKIQNKKHCMREKTG